jgi:hypothetical protein
LQVWLRDLLPPGIANNPEASKESSWELQGVLKHQVGGRVLLRSTLVDTDMRRCSYQQPYTEEGEGEGEEHGGIPTLRRLESATEEYSRRELRRKALHSGALGCGSRGGRELKHSTQLLQAYLSGLFNAVC